MQDPIIEEIAGTRLEFVRHCRGPQASLRHAGHMTRKEACDQNTFMAKEVMPRLHKLAAPQAA